MQWAYSLQLCCTSHTTLVITHTDVSVWGVRVCLGVSWIEVVPGEWMFGLVACGIMLMSFSVQEGEQSLPGFTLVKVCVVCVHAWTFVVYVCVHSCSIKLNVECTNSM